MKPHGEFFNVLVPVTGTEADRHALRILSKLVDGKSASIVAVYVVEVPQLLPLDADMSAEVLRGEEALSIVCRDARELCKIKDNHLRTDILQARSAGAAIVDEAADLHCDLIVMSSWVRDQHGRPTVGETTSYVLEHAHCEVMLLRQPIQAAVLAGSRA